MILTANSIQKFPELGEHFAAMQRQRDTFNTRQASMRKEFGDDGLTANAGLPTAFWRRVDSVVEQGVVEVDGYDILEDLMGVQTVQDIGYTVSQYIKSGGIADDVSITMDGHAPHSFDHTEYDTDGDPVPMFRSGFGANWRFERGMSNAGINLILDSQREKLAKHNKALVDYALNGSSRIVVDGKQGQGVKNHRNTGKIDLNASGAVIDLTTATPAQLATFFTTGPFGKWMRDNRKKALTKLWVSPEIWANLSKPYSDAALMLGTVMQALNIGLGGAFDTSIIEQTYGLTGNEFLGYVREKRYVSPIVGMATSVIAIPRQLPEDNTNFRILTGLGMQVRKDGDGRSGVVYGANLT